MMWRIDEINRLRAELTDLKEDCEARGANIAELDIEIERLRADVQKLREALRLFVTEGLSRAAANRLLAETAEEKE